MTREEMINAIGPCSILCYTCFGYINGGIREHAACLHELYKGWYEGHVNVYKHDLTKERIEKLNRINIFNEMLEELYNKPGCEGCQPLRPIAPAKARFGSMARGCARRWPPSALAFR